VISQFAGFWLGIVVIAGATFVAIVLGLLFVDLPSRLAIGGLWVVVVGLFAWGMYQSRMRRR
jgi:hypothetical protein